MVRLGTLAVCAGFCTSVLASDVLKLTAADFNTAVQDSKVLLAEFFAPWCGHCKALAPEYEKAATELKEKAEGIKLAQIDCTEESELCARYGVQGYPTLKVFRGSPEEARTSQYAGARKSDAIVSYLIKQSLPAVSHITKENFDGFKGSDKVVVVGFFDATDNASNATFAEVAEANREQYLFGATSDRSVAKSAGISKLPGIVVFKTFDEGKDVYDGAFEKDGISKFVADSAIPLFGEIGPETYTAYMTAGLPLAYVFCDSSEMKEKMKEQITPVAKSFKGKVSFASIDAVQFGGHAANLNLEQKWPAFAIQDPVKNTKYPFDQSKEITTVAIETFISNFVGGKVKPSIKSEPIPEMQEEAVYKVVADNYEDIVLDDSKDVLIEFYASWCGHCKNLAPTFESLAEKYNRTPSLASLVTVSKVDATLNDVPDAIQGFPTIKLYPAGNKQNPVEYSGDRTLDSFVEFIAQHWTHKADANNPPADGAGLPRTDFVGGHGAPAATKAAEAAAAGASVAASAAGSVAGKVADAAAGAAGAILGDAEDLEHDEL